MVSRRWMIGLMVALMASLTACSYGNTQVRLGWVETSRSSGIEARFDRFDGMELRSLNLDVGDQLVIDFQAELDNGSLDVQMLDPDGSLVDEARFDKPGNARITVTAEDEGNYRIQIVGKGASGGFVVHWERN